MKNKVIAVLATFGMVATASAIKVNNNLSINGFIDGSYYSQDNGANNDTSNVGLDEVEINLLVNAGNVSGEIHIDTENNRRVENSANAANPNDSDSGDDLSIEQVHFTYSFQNGAALQVGRFGSALGLEGEDPAGLYTFSRAYGNGDFNLGNVDNAAHVQEGGRLSYSLEAFTGSFSLSNPVGTAEEGQNNLENDLDYELAITYTGFANLTVTAGAQAERAATDVDVWTINGAYTLDKLLIAAEYINRDDAGQVLALQETTAYSVIADYDINNQLGIAVRYSEWEDASGGSLAESDKLTIAPNYAITESLGAIIEFSAQEDSDGTDTDSVAIELTYTF
jgi:hypothetical protein